MACQECVAFNPNEQYFANYSADGKIKIWDTSTGTLKHEYTPNLHLSSPCTSIHWISLTSPLTSPQKKKKRNSNSFYSSLNALAIGLKSGKLLIFSLSTGTIVSDLCTDETIGNAISAITYEPDLGEIISVTQDNKIYTWKLCPKEIKLNSHWKCAAPQNITSLLVVNKGEWLLCGHLSISLWERSSMELLKTFTGHASEISQMLYMKSAGPDDKSYFISSAKGDRFLSVWSLAQGSRSKSAIASLILDDVPNYSSVNIQGNGEPVCVVAVTRLGTLHLFKHQLNGKISKPVKPKLNIQIAADTTKDKVSTIPLIAAKICNLNFNNILIAYGSINVVTFEKIDINTKEPSLTLVRKDSTKPIPINEESITKVKEPEVSDKVEYLQSGSCTSTKTPLARKRALVQTPVEASIEERIENLKLEKKISQDTPKGDSLTQLLIQGLQSKDRRILQVVFSKSDINIIESTIRRLPLQNIVPLVRELISLSDGRTHTAILAVQWLRAVILIHSSYLVTNHELLAELFSPLYGKIEGRLSIMAPLSRLRGRLDILVGQITQITNRETSGFDPSSNTLLDYQDEDDSDELEDQLIMHSESEENVFNSESDEDDINPSDHENMQIDDNSEESKNEGEEEEEVEEESEVEKMDEDDNDSSN